MSERVSDERLARACEHGGHSVHALAPSEKCDLALDLRDARARLAAWEPVVKAAVGQYDARATWDRALALPSHLSLKERQVAEWAYEQAKDATAAAVDALPPEHQP